MKRRSRSGAGFHAAGSPAVPPLHASQHPLLSKEASSLWQKKHLSKPLDNLATSAGPDFTGRFHFFLPLTKKLHLFKAKSIRRQYEPTLASLTAASPFRKAVSLQARQHPKSELKAKLPRRCGRLLCLLPLASWCIIHFPLQQRRLPHKPPQAALRSVLQWHVGSRGVS